MPIIELPFIKLRNVITPTSIKAKTAFVRSTQLPDLMEPQAFIEKMIEWEKCLGTAYAALAGVLMVSGADQKPMIIEGFEVFHRLCNQLSSEVKIRSEDDLGKLDAIFRQNFFFSRGATNMLEGLKRFEANFNGAGQFVGDCNIAAALFAMMPATAGVLTGSAHSPRFYHSYAYFRDLAYTFELMDIQKTALAAFGNSDAIIFSNLFSFVSVFIVSTLSAGQTKDRMSFPIQERRKILALLCLAEAINPLHGFLYKIRANVYQSMGEYEAASDAHQEYEKMKLWSLPIIFS